MNNVFDIMHKKVLSMMLYADGHGQGQKRTALEWVSFVKNIIHVNKIVVMLQLNSKIKGEFHCCRTLNCTSDTTERLHCNLHIPNLT